nr:MAG TPA: hypothetical protein [Caudoviricetes sp.]
MKCHTRIVSWDVGRPKGRIDRQNIIMYNINVLKRKCKNKHKRIERKEKL